jgi:hypothetical protein
VRFLLVAVVMLLALLNPALAHASEDAREAARRHYERGLALTNAADYGGALSEFRQAYAKSPNFAVLYNVGQAEAVLGHPVEAIAALSRYLKDGGAEVPEPRRTEVEAQIRQLQAKLAELTVATDQVGAIVRIDGKEIGTTPLYEPVRLAAGRHVVALIAGARTETSTVDLAEGERRTLSLSVPEAPADKATVVASPAPPPASPVPPPALSHRTLAEPRSKAPQVIGYVLAGTGVALGGGALVHYFWNRGRYEDWRAEHAALDANRFATDFRRRQSANNELADSITRASRVSVTLALAAGALAAGGVALLLTSPDEEREDAGARVGFSARWTGGRGGEATAVVAW